MILNRDTLCLMMQAALASGENRFARQTALAWLSAFPGDLEVSLYQARAILAEGRPGLVVAALDMVVRKDPEFLSAYQTLAAAVSQTDPGRFTQAATNAYVLGDRALIGSNLPRWGEVLGMTLQAVNGGQWQAADRLVQESLRAAPESPLAAIAHLKLSRATQEAHPTLQLAQLYHNRWPDCLPVNLILAEVLMELGQEQEAVHLLHQCVTHDAAGQTARRLWGAEHPYRSLWVEDMVIPFDQPIPAAVAARLGWNQLQAGVPLGELSDVEPADSAPATDASSQTANPTGPSSAPGLGQAITMDEGAPGMEPDGSLPDDYEDSLISEPGVPAERSSGAKNRRANGRAAKNGSREASTGALRHVEHEFDRLAKKLHLGGPGQTDARFPVYVIFTTRSGLVNQYGPHSSQVIDMDLRRLAGVLRQRAGWDAMVYYPDDPNCAGQFGLEAVTEQDPWKLKLALVDLDKALARRGEMIGALLIVGGDNIVPFHRLPNPTDDMDRNVPSDNPYGTRDANYFVTEWPVGRLPGEPGPDAGSLLVKIRSIQSAHTHTAPKGAKRLPRFGWLTGFFDRLRRKKPASNLGYTAAVWRRSSLAVFRPIGAPHTVLASPPESSGSFDRQRITKANLGYYNLHGTEDSPDWYGQRDPGEIYDGPDYPVALKPEDLHRNGSAPKVVFSEACFGGHVFDKNENQSLALKFLTVGTHAVVASTCTAYGSVSTPLIAADLLGNLFWQHLKAGRTVGDSLSQARLDLTREMNRRQGYLDSEDQKTLISFVLYGDPLATYNGFHVRGKTIQRSKEHPVPKTVCDHMPAGEQPPAVSHEVLKHVKALVSEYLPGAELGDVHLSRQHATCSGKNHTCPTADLGRGAKTTPEVGRLVVTMSKQVNIAEHVHRHYIRVTLDEHGSPVKFAISR